MIILYRIANRFTLFQFIVFVSLLSGCNFNIKYSGPHVTLDSLATYDYAALLRLVEKEDRLKDSLTIGSQGESIRYTIVMPDTDTPLMICWADTSRKVIKSMELRGRVTQEGNWITNDSLTVGLNLVQLEKINGAAVTVDDKGLITSWGNGKLSSGMYSVWVGPLQSADQRGVISITLTPAKEIQSSALFANYNPDTDISDWDDSLKKYFTPEQIPVVKRAAYEFNHIKSSSDLAHFYLVTIDSVIKIVNTQIEVSDPLEYSGDNRAEAHWAWFADYFSAIDCDVLCSECSYEALTVVEPLVNKAAQTPDKDDDLFFSLPLYIYDSYDGRGGSIGNEGGWYKVEGCDFCAASLLGSGQRYAVVQLLEKAGLARPLFGSVMDKYMSSIVSVKDDHYSYNKVKVLAELDQLLASNSITTEDKKLMKETRDAIATGEKGIQFDCENGCDWPEY